MLVSMENMLNRAFARQYAVGQFNINNRRDRTVLKVAQQLVPGYFRCLRRNHKTYVGLKCIHDIVVNAMEFLK